MAYPRLDSHGLSTMLTRLASVIRQGHTIKSDDATMTQRKNLKIIGATVTDNALADQTEVRFPNGGHTIISSSMLPIGGSTLPMAGRDNLQFGSEYDPVFTEDDATNNKTIVHGQLFICDSESDWKTLSDETFKAKYGADREQVGVYWYRPWANSIAYQTDLTPVGAVLSYAVDTTNTTIFPADLVEFPNKDYLICRGATVKITDYPALYNYFEDNCGDGNYFGTSQTAEGYFVLPNWSADFPTNGVLVIKARVTSDVITFAEVDQTGESARTDEVPSCARVAAIEEEVEDISTMLVPEYSSATAPTGASFITVNRTIRLRYGKMVYLSAALTVSQNISQAVDTALFRLDWKPIDSVNDYGMPSEMTIIRSSSKDTYSSYIGVKKYSDGYFYAKQGAASTLSAGDKLYITMVYPCE